MRSTTRSDITSARRYSAGRTHVSSIAPRSLRTHAFYEKHGGITIIVARFLPFIRTFAPFVAGVAAMTYARFALFNVIGAVLWVVSLTTLGYLLGNTTWVRDNFQWVTLAMIIIPGLPAVYEVLRHTLFKRRAASPAANSAAGS